MADSLEDSSAPAALDAPQSPKKSPWGRRKHAFMLVACVGAVIVAGWLLGAGNTSHSTHDYVWLDQIIDFPLALVAARFAVIAAVLVGFAAALRMLLQDRLPTKMGPFEFSLAHNIVEGVKEASVERQEELSRVKTLLAKAQAEVEEYRVKLQEERIEHQALQEVADNQYEELQTQSAVLEDTRTRFILTEQAFNHMKELYETELKKMGR